MCTSHQNFDAIYTFHHDFTTPFSTTLFGYFIVSDEGAKSGHAPCKGGNGISQVKYIIKRVTHQDTAGQAPRTVSTFFGSRTQNQINAPVCGSRTKNSLHFFRVTHPEPNQCSRLRVTHPEPNQCSSMRDSILIILCGGQSPSLS